MWSKGLKLLFAIRTGSLRPRIPKTTWFKLRQASLVDCKDEFRSDDWYKVDGDHWKHWVLKGQVKSYNDGSRHGHRDQEEHQNTDIDVLELWKRAITAEASWYRQKYWDA